MWTSFWCDNCLGSSICHPMRSIPPPCDNHGSCWFSLHVVVDFPCMRPACGGNHGSFLPCKRKCSLARPSRLLWYNFLACKRKLLSINQIKSNKKLFSSRGYYFPSCKTTEHDYLPHCGGGRSLRWRSRHRLTGGGRSLASASKRTISPSPASSRS